MSDNSALQKFFGDSFAVFRKVFGTVNKDLSQRDSQAFQVALKAFGGNRPNEALDEDELAEYNLLQHLAAVLTSLEKTIDEEGAELPKPIRQLLEKEIKAVAGEGIPLDEGMSPLVRIMWGVMNGLLISWELAIAGYGRDRAFLPKRLPTQFSSICIFAQYLLSPTPGNLQLLDMSIQRTGMNLPNQIAYTWANFQPEIYGTGKYTGGTVAASLGLVAMVVIPKELTLRYHDKSICYYLTILENEDLERSAGNKDLMETLQLHCDALEEVRDLLKKTKNEFSLASGTNDQATRALSAMRMLIGTLRSIVHPEGSINAEPDDWRISNPDRNNKLAVMAFGEIVIGFTLGPSLRNPVLFVQSLQWGIWYTYRLQNSVRNQDHKVRNTMELMVNAGTVPIFAFPLISIPLIARGPSVFDDTKLLIISCVLMWFLNASIGHKVGPAGSAIITYLAKKLTTAPEPVEPETNDDDLHRLLDVLEEAIMSVEDESDLNNFLFTRPLASMMAFERRYKNEAKNQDSALPGAALGSHWFSALGDRNLSHKQRDAEDTGTRAGSRETEQTLLTDLFSALELPDAELQTRVKAEMLCEEMEFFKEMDRVFSIPSFGKAGQNLRQSGLCLRLPSDDDQRFSISAWALPGFS